MLLEQAQSPQMREARNPRSGAIDYRFEVVSPADLKQDMARARAAQPAWAALGVHARGAVLRRFAAAIEQQRPALQAALETDTGRRRATTLEIDSVIASIAAWTSLAANRSTEDWIEGRSNKLLRHRPQWIAYPVCAVISPWNFPLLLAMIDAIPALLAGCAVVVKPSEVTPRFIAALLPAIAAIPELTDLLQVKQGDGSTGEIMIDHADLVCFTGSLATGRLVARRAAARLIPAFLELGGKDPLLVMQGADLDAATDAALRGSVVATGQACQSIERIYVARSLHDEFVAKLVRKAKAVTFNWPDIAKGDLGPIIWARQADIIAEQIDDAIRRGAKLKCGGVIEHHGGGRWLAPTVLTDVVQDMSVMREETFGPVMPVMAFDSVDEAVGLANSGVYGLSAAVFAGSIADAELVGRRIDAGAISLNDAALTALFYEAPKQSFKQSGLGPSRMGEEGFTRFFRRKALIANHGRPAPLELFREDFAITRQPTGD